MSALGALLIFSVIVLIAGILGIAALLLIKDERIHKTIFIILAVFTIVLSYLGATSIATNFIVQQIIGWSWGVMALVAIGLKFFSTKYAKYAKYLLIFTTAACIYDLVFF